MVDNEEVDAEEETWMECECEYCSLQGTPDCPYAQSLKERDDRVLSLLTALRASPCKYNELADLKTLRELTRRYNKWVDEVRNPVYQSDKKDWLKVAQALSDLSALKSIAENLKAFEEVNLYNGEKITITIKKLDGTVQELNGDWLARVAAAELDEKE
jgi:hypothetical protein